MFRYAGFFSNLEHGFRKEPLLIPGLGTYTESERDLIAKYLEGGAHLLTEMGVVYDPVTQEVADLGPVIMTDGLWIWPRDLARFVARHRVDLPKPFLDHMKRHEWTVPRVGNFTQLFAIAAVLWRWRRPLLSSGRQPPPGSGGTIGQSHVHSSR